MNESRSSRYHRHRRWAEGASLCARALMLAGFVVTGVSSPWLGDSAAAEVASWCVPAGLVDPFATAVFGLILSVVGDVVVLPFSFYSTFLLERRYRRSRVGVWAWFSGYRRMMILHAGLWIVASGALQLMISRWPETWWLIAGGIYGVLTVAMAHLGPVVSLSWWSDVRALDRPTLRTRLEALVRRAEAPALDVLEWKVGLETPPRAALVGLGSTRRVLLSDSLLADYSDDEIEVVVAHELAHHLHHDAWRTLAYEFLTAVAVCGGAHLALRAFGPAFDTGVSGALEGLPLLALAGGGMVMVLTPLGNLLSRDVTNGGLTVAPC